MRSLEEIKYMNDHPEDFVGCQGEILDKITQQILKAKKIGLYLPGREGIIDVYFVEEEMKTSLGFPVFRCQRKLMQNVALHTERMG